MEIPQCVIFSRQPRKSCTVTKCDQPPQHLSRDDRPEAAAKKIAIPPRDSAEPAKDVEVLVGVQNREKS